MFNQEQVVATVRSILLTAGASLVTQGVIDQVTLNAIIGGLLALGTWGWSLYRKRAAGIVKTAANLPEVKQITTTDAISVDHPKVV